ncbi:MAG: glycosyltransferase family 2 protein [Aureliella sp.]
MSQLSTPSRSSWESNAEPTQLSLPVHGRDRVIDRAEQQFDQLLDLLAADQIGADTRRTNRRPAAARQNAGLAPTRMDVELQASRIEELLEASLEDDLSSSGSAENELLELSIVMPCLDEGETIGNCVLKAMYALEKLGVEGEVIVADNGSRDESVEIAEALGARVIHVDERGYGAALMAGIAAARGKFIVMGDADDSYDFTCVPKFYERLCEGADLVQGCRLPSGGGRIMPGAMPKLHQWGNPLLTWMVRKMFRAPVNDVYCGMRGFRKDFYERLDQRCTGMEFATEMIIKSALFGARISEIPITLYKDGRTLHRPHLRTFRDGWRTLRFYMLQSPRWTFLMPGAVLGGFGLIGAMLALFNVNIAGVVFDAHTLLVSTLALLVAAQLASAAVLAKTFASGEGMLPRDARLEKLARIFTLERCLTLAGGLVVGGLAVVAWTAASWAGGGFGSLDYSSTMKCLIPAIGAVALGVQGAASSFLLSVLRMARR